MTEKQAIDALQFNRPFAYGEMQSAVDVAIEALSEIQQYRAIGTVERLKDLPAICDSLAESSEKAEKLIKELQAYRAIGTVEGYKRAVEVSKENYYLYAEYKAKLKEYETIGTIEEFKALKENSFFNFDSPIASVPRN